MKKQALFILFAVVITIVILTMFSACSKGEKALTTSELLGLGEKYLLEMNYEQAVAQFLKVIEIEPMNPRGYIGAAEAYVGSGQVDDAINILKKGLEVLADDVSIIEVLAELGINLEDDTTPLPVALQTPDPNAVESERVLTDREIQFATSLSNEQNTLLAKLKDALHKRDHDSAWSIITSDEYMALSEILPEEEAQIIRLPSGLTLELMGSFVERMNRCGAWIDPDSAGNGEFTRAHFGYWVDENGEMYTDFRFLESIQYKDGIANGDYLYINKNQNHGDYADSYQKWDTFEQSGQIVNGFRHGEQITVHEIDDGRIFRYLTIYENGKVIPFGTEIRDGQNYYQVSQNIDTGEFDIADADYLEQIEEFGTYR